MKYSVNILLILLATNCFPQSATLMQILTGKSIALKDTYESVTADYSLDSDSLTTKDNHSIDLYPLSSGYQRQESVKSKIDFYANGKDTIIYTYGFFRGRLFQVKYYSNCDSANKVAIRKIKEYFKNIEMIYHGNSIEYTSKKAVENMLFDSRWYCDEKRRVYTTFEFTLTYKPIKKYLPTWCGTGKPKNWVDKMEKELTSH